MYIMLTVSVWTLLAVGFSYSMAAGDSDWWKRTIVYQIYPRSFQDSDGDGVGDLKGIISRLDHFQYLHIDTLWLSPIYTSPMVDFGYDISDHKDIDPIFGTMQDFDELLRDVHSRGMYLIMDFIPNHTSDNHTWFLESRKGGADNPYADYYVWRDGKVLEDGTRGHPNNWLGVFGHSSWTWDDVRQQYYLHQFTPEQPDLNYRNPKVVQDMIDVLKFWVEKGVDGFRVDAIQTLYEDTREQDEPLSNKPAFKPEEYGYLDHIYTGDQPEIHETTALWRNMFDEYEARTGKHIFMVMEAYSEDLPQLMKYYHSGSDMSFNFNLLFADKQCGGSCYQNFIQAWLDLMPEGKWPNYVLGNHDNRRITSKKGEQYASALNMLLLTLPGTPTTYYGEEIGQLDVHVSYEDTQDPWGRSYGPDLYEKYSRDPCRAPMQWTSEQNAGFSTADKTWLPVHPDYASRNVKDQKRSLTGQSTLQVYRELAWLRQDDAFSDPTLDYVTLNDNVISYVRKSRDTDAYLVAINLGQQASTDSLVVKIGDRAYTQGTIVVTTGVLQGKDMDPGDVISLNSVTLNPAEGLVVKLVLKQAKDEL